MKAPIEWFCWDYEDDQIRDALRMIEERRRWEKSSCLMLRAILWMLATTWAIVLVRSIIWR